MIAALLGANIKISAIYSQKDFIKRVRASKPDTEEVHKPYFCRKQLF
jgi:hypothetical protein